MVVVPAPGRGPGHWAGAPSAVVDGGDGLARLPVASTGRRRSRRRRRGGPLRRRGGVRDRGAGRARGVRRGIPRAAGPGAPPRRRLAPLPQLRDPRLQALVGRGPRRRHPSRPARAAGAPWCTPGSAAVGVKDPVVPVDDDGWWMWLCCHPLDVPGHEDRMTTRLFRSDDGLAWADLGEVLRGTPGTWDARGARVTAVALPGPARRALRRPGHGRGELVRAHRHRPVARRRARRSSPTTAAPRHPRRTATARCATRPPSRCPAAACAGTPRSPTPTAPTT